MSHPLIVAALKDEIRIFKSKIMIDTVLHLKPPVLHRGRFGGKDIDLLVTGVGAKRMEEGLEKAFQYITPSMVLQIGYGGGTSPVVGLGTLALADKVLFGGTSEIFEADTELLQQAEELCRKKEISFQRGSVVSVDRVISDPHQKADIGATHGAIALDMEAAMAARFMAARKIPFLVVKAILDPMEMKLPDMVDCIDEDGDTRLGEVADHLVRHPKDMMQLPKMQYNATQARNALTAFLESWV